MVDETKVYALKSQSGKIFYTNSELKVRNASAGKFAGIFRINLHLYDNELAQLQELYPELKAGSNINERVVAKLLEVAKVSLDKRRAKDVEATPEKSKLEHNIVVVRALTAKLEASRGGGYKATDKDVLEIIKKCPTEEMQKALIEKFCLVVPSAKDEFVFV